MDDCSTEGQCISIQDENAENISVTLRGNLSIAEALSLRAELGKVLALGRGVTLDGASVERIDTAALQVLWAFTRELMQRQVSIKWAEASTELQQAASLLGLADSMELMAQ